MEGKDMRLPFHRVQIGESTKIKVSLDVSVFSYVNTAKKTSNIELLPFVSIDNDLEFLLLLFLRGVPDVSQGTINTSTHSFSPTESRLVAVLLCSSAS